MKHTENVWGLRHIPTGKLVPTVYGNGYVLKKEGSRSQRDIGDYTDPEITDTGCWVTPMTFGTLKKAKNFLRQYLRGPLYTKIEPTALNINPNSAMGSLQQFKSVSNSHPVVCNIPNTTKRDINNYEIVELAIDYNITCTSSSV